jgi:COMPASS component SPP1
MESKTSFASKYKTQIDDARMFCDFYNPKEDTYCKRLQVLCPEHNPDPRFIDDEVSKGNKRFVHAGSKQRTRTT